MCFIFILRLNMDLLEVSMDIFTSFFKKFKYASLTWCLDKLFQLLLYPSTPSILGEAVWAMGLSKRGESHATQQGFSSRSA
jgi:hypothetical protein